MSEWSRSYYGIKGWRIMRIKCYCDLYVSASLESKKNQILKNLMENKLQPAVYVLTLSQGEQNHLEFFSALLLKQHVFEHTDLFVVGIADGYDDAVYLVEEITQEVLDETGGTDIRGYIIEQQRQFDKNVHSDKKKRVRNS